MKKRFRSNMIADCESGQSNIPVEQRIKSAKDAIKRLKNQVKDIDRHMDTMKDMSSDYDHNGSHIAELVGSLYMKKDYVLGEIQSTKQRIKLMKKEK